MPFYLLTILIVALLIVSFVRSRRLDEPHKIVLFQWIGLLLLYNILDHGLFPLSPFFYLAVALWVLTFFLGSFFTNFFLPRIRFGEVVNPIIVKAFFFLIILSLPFIAVLTFRNATIGPTEYWFLNLRLANMGEGDDFVSYGIFAFAFPLSHVTLWLIYSNRNKFNRFYIIGILIINLLLALTTVSKTAFLFTLLPLLFLKSNRKKTSTKNKIFFGTVVLAIVVLLTFIRTSDNPENTSSDFVRGQVLAYTLSSMTAFDQVKYTPDVLNHQFGGYTFRFLYAMGSSLGMVKKDHVVPSIQEYVEVPLPANVYTVMYPFYKDFGLSGIVIFGFIVGAFFGVLYRWRLDSSICNVFFLAIVPQLFFQYFNEILFANFSYNLQIFLMILVAHVPQFRLRNDRYTARYI